MSQKASIDWDSVPLGQFNDRAIAKWLGVGLHAVFYQRRIRNIPACRKHGDAHVSQSSKAYRRAGTCPQRRPKNIDWDAQPLGKIPDVELAKRLGVSLASVWSARKKRGIAKFEVSSQSISEPLNEPSVSAFGGLPVYVVDRIRYSHEED